MYMVVFINNLLVVKIIYQDFFKTYDFKLQKLFKRKPWKPLGYICVAIGNIEIFLNFKGMPFHIIVDKFIFIFIYSMKTSHH